MAGDKEHIRIKKENLNNPRRSGRTPRFVKRDNLKEHGQKLAPFLAAASTAVKNQNTSKAGHYTLKLKYEGILTFKNLIAHGMEFISQEDSQICVAFTTEKGLSTFADHLDRLGVDDDDITYKQLLEALTSIEAWSEEDRASWAVKHYGFPADKQFVIDVELWPIDMAASKSREKLLSCFEQWLHDKQLVKLDRVNLDSFLMYRVKVNQAQADLLLSHIDVRLVDLLPVSGINYQMVNKDIAEIPQGIPSPKDDAPKICILDSGINTNHPLIKPAMAESASFIPGEDENDLAGHGTQVAGIALYGNLEECNTSNYWNPQAWLYNGKILNDECQFDAETIESTLMQAVEYFVELGCRIFNLSIGNENSPYDGKHIRGIAYILDLLSRKHDILFVVSVGNFRGVDEPPIPKDSWRDEYPEYLLGTHNAIIDPAPALNVLTVGSLVLHDATRSHEKHPNEINHLAAGRMNQPSPFTRHGPSVRGTIKPELMAYGGNFASPMRFNDKQWQRQEHEPGVLSLNPNFVGNTLFVECHGTSFSAPYITHLAGRLLDNYPTASANMLRALLINQADMPSESVNTFTEQFIKGYAKKNGRRPPYCDLAGYGLINEENLYRSDGSAVILMAEDTIKNDSYQFYELPLPEEFLRTNKATREIRVSLCYAPAVRTTRLEYKATGIVFNLLRGESLEEVQKHFHKEMQEENKTLGDTISSKNNRIITAEIRGKGTAQCSLWRFKKLKPDNKWFVVVTRKDAYGWGDALALEDEKYSLVVSVTDRENEEAQLYSQISQQIQNKERVRV